MNELHKELDKLRALLNENEEVFDSFNYKLYNVFYHGNLDLHGMKYENVVCCILDRMYFDYVDELDCFEKNKSGAETKLSNIGRTSSMYVEPVNSDYYVYDEDLYFYTYINCIYDVAEVESLRDICKLSNAEWDRLILDYMEEEEYNPIDDIVSGIEELHFQFLGVVQTYHFIQQYKAMVDDPISFQREVDRYLLPEDLVSGMEIDNFALEEMEYEYGLMVKRAGNKAKVWTSFTKQPVLVTIYWGEYSMKVLKRRYLNKAERQKIRDRLFQLQEEFHNGEVSMHFYIEFRLWFEKYLYVTYNISKREANRIVFTYKYKICGII